MPARPLARPRAPAVKMAAAGGRGRPGRAGAGRGLRPRGHCAGAERPGPRMKELRFGPRVGLGLRLEAVGRRPSGSSEAWGWGGRGRREGKGREGGCQRKRGDKLGGGRGETGSRHAPPPWRPPAAASSFAAFRPPLPSGLQAGPAPPSSLRPPLRRRRALAPLGEPDWDSVLQGFTLGRVANCAPGPVDPAQSDPPSPTSGVHVLLYPAWPGFLKDPQRASNSPLARSLLLLLLLSN